MLTKVYLYTWLAIGALFVAQYIAGSMTMLAVVVFGFIAFGMIFMGMIAVLPFIATHSNEKIRSTIEPETKLDEASLTFVLRKNRSLTQLRSREKRSSTA
jgi:hypothetical protein